ncbi:hypothetical protein TSAR_003263 [Trichomalopsis sarcophagae]|uniref:S1 motif domain-containing protein n=1 Tax=Trichomalopsis sarcophagae TaxID=543379 RepID=A0A232F1H8_9HYME|nr:hypothetical protein TSAR_003263 [Trichomalopsis sarcophagae]
MHVCRLDVGETEVCLRSGEENKRVNFDILKKKLNYKNFPRGGKKPVIKPSNNLFSKRTKIKAKKLRSKPNKTKEEASTDDGPLVANTAQNLRLSSLHEGMVIVGRIFRVTDYHAFLSLPGQISAKLQATDISDSYTNSLKSIAKNEEISEEFKPMSDLYKEGDYVVCYVKSFNPNTKKVSVSLEPQLINQSLNPGTLVKRSKVVLSISSVEDHGYVLETGLKNFRAFLSIKDIADEETKLFVGKQIICAVKDVKTAENTYTAKVSIKTKHLDTVETNITSLDSLIPTAQFPLTVKKVLKNGLQVEFGENSIGYINQLYLQNSLDSFEKGQELVGTLLYIVPTMKFGYFSLLPQEVEQKLLAIGDVITKAKFVSKDSRGIILQLKKGVRGYVPLKRTEVQFEKIDSVFTKNSIHKCKILAYDSIARVYICSMEKKVIEKTVVNKTILQPGHVVEVKITKIKKNGYISVSSGTRNGFVPADQVSDPGSKATFKVGQNVTARVLETSVKNIFTLKKSLIESKLPILCKMEDAKADAVHDGTVSRITDAGILIRFFDGVKGFIPKKFLNNNTASAKWNMVVGQTVSTIIKDVDVRENKLILSLVKGAKAQNTKFKIGDVVEGIVTDSSAEGVQLRLKSDGEEAPTAYLPAGHMSPCYEVGKLLASKTVAGESVTAIVFSTMPTLILSTTFAPEKTYKIHDLKPEDTVMCSVKKIHKESVKVLMPLVKSSKFGTVPAASAGNIESMYENQILIGKVTRIEKDSQEISLTTQLSKVWKSVSEHDVKMMTAVDVLSSYLNKVTELSRNVYYTSKPISKLSIGQRIKGSVESVMDHGLILKLENNVKGIVRTSHFTGNVVPGQEVEGSVLWINYPHEYVELTLIRSIMNGISIKQNKLAKIPVGVQLRGEIVLITDWFVLVVLKGQGKGTLVTLPSRRHLNDIVPDLTPYQIRDKVRCFGVLNGEDADILLPICMLKSSFEIHIPRELEKPQKRKLEAQNGNEKVSVAKKSKNLNVNEEIKEEKSEGKQVKKETAEPAKPAERKKVKAQLIDGKKPNKRKRSEPVIKSAESSGDDEVSDEEVEPAAKAANTKPTQTLAIPECGFQWDNSTTGQVAQDSSSSSEDEEQTEDSSKPKKKKLTPAERREQERLKEREIREREEALASCQVPQTVDQFDRLVLSSPDSSLVWMQYMAYHLQATEIEKARAVARRALKTINFREEDERLNVWQAWLNLESRFGTAESLNEVFQEAVKTNDAQKVYTHMLTVHGDAGRQADLEKLTSAMIAKFKQNPETWISCGTALLKIGMKDKSRHIMQRALQSLPATKHVDLLVRFAQLENRLGDKERAQTLFEQVLTSYPKRTDVWSSYVDSLIKSGDIEIARKVLDRAITQGLPPKKMKVLFKKYIDFESKHGTPENVSRIQELAVKYVEEQCKKLD